MHNPLRIMIVVISVVLATTLATAVFRVSVASVNSFEQGIAGGVNPYHLLISPVGGRFTSDGISSCLSAGRSSLEIVRV